MLISVKLYRIICELFAKCEIRYYICTRIKTPSDHYSEKRINSGDPFILKRTLTYKQLTKIKWVKYLQEIANRILTESNRRRGDFWREIELIVCWIKPSQRNARPRRGKRLKSVNGGIIPLSRIVPLEYIQNWQSPISISSNILT